jgi:uncharacterized Zn-binding protein involved in type VI secretion
MTFDPGMDGKVAILKELMAPDWGVTLDTFKAANVSVGPGIVAEPGSDEGLGSIDPTAVLGAAAKFLPPEAQKAAAAAMALAKGDPIGAVMAVLPPEAQAAASVALPLAMGNLDGALMGLAGKFMPPELQPVFSAFMQMGGLSGVLGIKLPQLPSPFVKPDAGQAPDPDLSTDAGSGPGSALWAARISDLRSCPKGAGPIITGQMNVLIGFMPAARIGDKGVCIGPPDVIMVGEPTVKIGGSPASRKTDGTAHGGSIQTGFPKVHIGKSQVICTKCLLQAAARRMAFVKSGPTAG